MANTSVDTTTCPNCGARAASIYATGCPSCEWQYDGITDDSTELQYDDAKGNEVSQEVALPPGLTEFGERLRDHAGPKLPARIKVEFTDTRNGTKQIVEVGRKTYLKALRKGYGTDKARTQIRDRVRRFMPGKPMWRDLEHHVRTPLPF